MLEQVPKTLLFDEHKMNMEQRRRNEALSRCNWDNECRDLQEDQLLKSVASPPAYPYTSQAEIQMKRTKRSKSSHADTT